MNGELVLNINGHYFPIFAAAFDLEGTVINLEEFHWAAHRKVAKRLGIDLPNNIDDIRKLLPHFVGGPDFLVMKEIRELAITQGASREKIEAEWPIDKMVESKKAIYQSGYEKAHIAPREGVTAIMNLIGSSLPYGICSVTQYLEMEAILERSGLRPMLSGRPIFYYDGNIRPKPAPRTYI